MARGGARNRSGPQPDPNSERSERRGFKLTALPAEGYDGPAPAWPLKDRIVWHEYVMDGQKIRERDDDGTAALRDRELELWNWAWTTPQACAWSMPSESWRLHTIAMWVRTYALCESSDATAADKGSLHRFADQIGMTPAGLRENGWQIAPDETAVKREERAASAAPKRASSRDRLKVVSGGGG